MLSIPNHSLVNLYHNEREKVAVARGMNLGIAQGIERKLIELVCKKMRKGKSPEIIAEELDEEPKIIQNIYERASSLAPDYNFDDVYKVYFRSPCSTM